MDLKTSKKTYFRFILPLFFLIIFLGTGYLSTLPMYQQYKQHFCPHAGSYLTSDSCHLEDIRFLVMSPTIPIYLIIILALSLAHIRINEMSVLYQTPWGKTEDITSIIVIILCYFFIGILVDTIISRVNIRSPKESKV